MRRTILCDVDGVVADLMGAFDRWLWSEGLPGCDPKLITLFDIRKAAREPGLVQLDEFYRQPRRWPREGGDGGINGAFMEFMGRTDTYEWVRPIPGAVEALDDLRRDHDVFFVTALMKRCPDHVPSKMRWLDRHFPDIEYFTSPAKWKQMIRGTETIAIDDRYDTCQRFAEAGAPAYVFKQPWNEVPARGMLGDSTVTTWEWPDLVKVIRGR